MRVRFLCLGFVWVSLGSVLVPLENVLICLEFVWVRLVCLGFIQGSFSFLGSLSVCLGSDDKLFLQGLF